MRITYDKLIRDAVWSVQQGRRNDCGGLERRLRLRWTEA